MWAYGITRSSLSKLNKIEPEHRKPSDGIVKFEIAIPEINDDEVLIEVKSSSLNFNSIWSGISHPVSPFQLISRHVQRNKTDVGHIQDFAVIGSDAAGIVSKVGKKVANWNVGDEVIVHCNVVDLNDPIVQQDGMLSESQSIWGYETNYGAFAEFTKVKSSQLIRKPKELSWAEAGSFLLTLSTAYRMLISENGTRLKPDDNCLIWGASGGLGVFAVQLVKLAGANAIAVVSSKAKEEIVKELGADVVINRKEQNLDQLVDDKGHPNYLAWKKLKNILSEHGVFRLEHVFEHVGRDTLGCSLSLLSRGGTVILCAASSGYNAVVDLRYLWMSVKRIIGSHFANYSEAKNAAELIFSGKIKPVIFDYVSIDELPKMADLMYKNKTYGKIVFNHQNNDT